MKGATVMKKSLKKIKKTRLFFIIAVVTQIASYAASIAMLYKKQKNAAGIFAAIGLLGTICSIALWKHDPDGIVPKKLKDKLNSKKSKKNEISEESDDILTQEEIDKIFAEAELEEEEFEGLDGAFDDLEKAVEALSSEENAEDEEL